MKKLLASLAIAASLFATPAIADACQVAGDLAETIAEKRYEGVTMSQMIEVATKGLEDGAKRAITQLIIWAYELPDYTMVEYQQRAILQFRSRMEIACYKNQMD